MTATTTIRLPPELRQRLKVLSRKTGRSAHSLIVEAGEVYRPEDVHAWMERLAMRHQRELHYRP